MKSSSCGLLQIIISIFLEVTTVEPSNGQTTESPATLASQGWIGQYFWVPYTILAAIFIVVLLINFLLYHYKHSRRRRDTRYGKIYSKSKAYSLFHQNLGVAFFQFSRSLFEIF